MEHKLIKSSLNSLNKAIRGVKLGRRNYMFRCDPLESTTIHELISLLEEYDKLNAQHATELTQKLREVAAPGLIQRLYDLFVPEGSLNYEQEKELGILLTPPRYFNFDLEYSQDDQGWTSLNANYGKGSGGEHQNPLYIVLAATMLQMYDNNPRRLRMVIMDEAFSKAPGSSEAGLQMLLDQGLQPILATPIGRADVRETIQYTLHVYRDEKDNVRVLNNEALSKAFGTGGGAK